MDGSKSSYKRVEKRLCKGLALSTPVEKKLCYRFLLGDYEAVRSDFVTVAEFREDNSGYGTIRLL